MILGLVKSIFPVELLMRIVDKYTWSLVVPRSPSDFIVDTIQEWWNDLTLEEQQQTQKIQLKVDNGPESSGVRTQFLKRMVEFADLVAKPIHLLYYPPYHSKYNPIERCWGILEKHWNGAKLTDALTMLLWARSMTWKGLNPVVKLNLKAYKKGISLTRKAMRTVERRLERNPLLPKWDILIRPAWLVINLLEAALVTVRRSNSVTFDWLSR